MENAQQVLENKKFFIRLDAEKLTKPIDFTVFKPTEEDAVKHITDVCMEYWGVNGFGKRTITVVDEAVYV